MSEKQGDAWRYSKRIGRLQLGLTVYCHRYANVSDRWVFQPSLIYDRKDRP